MKTWTQERPAKPVTVTSLQIGDATMYINSPNDEGKIWQSIIVSVGEHSTRAFSECQYHWPKEAAAVLRKIADRIERECNDMGLH